MRNKLNKQEISNIKDQDRLKILSESMELVQKTG